MSKLTVYIGNKNYSSWSMRGWLPLAKAGLAFDEVVIPLRTDASKAQINAVSPGGQVPALHVDDLRLYESIAIAEWAAEQAPDLWPQDAALRARARAAAALMHAGFRDLRMQCPMNMKVRNAAAPTDEAALADAARIDRLWQDWLAASGGPFLFGAWSIADAFYAPVVSRFITFSLPRSDVSQAYMDRMEAEPAYARWQAEALTERQTMPDIDTACGMPADS